MMGDFILFVKRILKQHVFCIHHYVRRGSAMFPEFTYEVCEKCGKLKE